MVADTGIQTHALYYLLRVQPLHLRIGVQLVEVRHPQRKICVGEQLHSLRLREPHDKGIYILLDGAFLQKSGEAFRRSAKSRILSIHADDYTGRVQVVIQRPGFPQEFRAENYTVAVELLTHGCCESHRNSGLYYHYSIGVAVYDALYDRLHRRSIEEILLAVIIGRRGDHDEIRVAVRSLRIQGRGQIQLLLSQILLYVLIPYRRLPPVDQLHLLRHDVHCRHRVVLSDEYRYGKSYVTCSCYCYFHNTYLLH